MNKYGSRLTIYNGVKYHSKLEAKHAQRLDLLIKAKEVIKYERQFKIKLQVKDSHICNYLIDFKVYLTNGNIEYHEVKGFETALWKLKYKLTKAIYPDYNLVLIKK